MHKPPAQPQHESLILASASPRRRELLTQIGVGFTVMTHAIDEAVRDGEPPMAYVQRLAREKAGAVAGAAGQRPVLGADTIVVCDEMILGKPVDRDDGLRMLNLLSGRTHQVYTAVAVTAAGACFEALSSSRVRFRTLTPGEQAQYWLSGEPLGKAGGYAIQGLAAMFVAEISGSYSGIVGLPLFETAGLLQQAGVATGLAGVPRGAAGTGEGL